MVEVPVILNIPEKLLPIITDCNKYSYFMLEGGRSGAKSSTIARWILYLGDQKKLRIVCGREIQNSIDESVYTLFADLIRKYNLAYQILATEIKHIKTGTAINFRGFREQGRQNIKGLEGVDILWVDEAQAITKETLDIIVPTIRKTNSKVYWTMNRFIENDPVYDKFYGRKDCLHIHISYLENKFCPQKMIDEANICKELSYDDYEHIWLGKPRKDGGVLKVVTTAMYEELRGLRLDKPIAKRLLTGDPSLGGDECVAYIINESGRKLSELFLHERDEMKIAGMWVALANRSGVKDFVIDTIGFKGIADRIRELVPGCRMTENIGSAASTQPKSYLNLRAEIYIYAMNEILNHRAEYFNDKEMVKQLCDIRIKALNSRKIKIESKDDIRKRILRSPDRADAYVQGLWGLQWCRPWRKADIPDTADEMAIDWRAS